MMDIYEHWPPGRLLHVHGFVFGRMCDPVTGEPLDPQPCDVFLITPPWLLPERIPRYEGGSLWIIDGTPPPEWWWMKPGGRPPGPSPPRPPPDARPISLGRPQDGISPSSAVMLFPSASLVPPEFLGIIPRAAVHLQPCPAGAAEGIGEAAQLSRAARRARVDPGPHQADLAWLDDAANRAWRHPYAASCTHGPFEYPKHMPD